MKLGFLIIGSLIIWIVSGYLAIFYSPSLEAASNFGESFGAVSALFSSFALALAIYSMVLQQKQNKQFEEYTLAALAQQSKQIEVLHSSISEQLKTAKVTAISTLIDRDEQQIENLKMWGKQQGDINKYENGISAASKRVKKYNETLQSLANS